MNKLFLPLGIEDFKEVKETCYYVDKTPFLNEIVNSPDTTVFLFTRPRRFGKSLLMSMVNYFFNEKYDSKKLFEDTLIYDDKHSIGLMNNYPVIHLNLKGINFSSFDSFINSMMNKMSIIYQEQLEGSAYDSLVEKDYINRIIDMTASKDELTISLEKILLVNKKIKNKTSMIIIDEYDAPFQNAYEYKIFDIVRDFFKVFLGGALKGNNNLFKAIITGVNQLSNTSIFSDLNNLVSNNILGNRDNEYFGFNKEETQKLFTYYNVEIDISKIKEWYGNYRFQNEEVFNPWSILSFIRNNNDFRDYWINTGSYKLINDMVYNLAETDFNKINSLIQGKTIEVSINESMALNDISTEEDIYSMLLYNGYLTFNRTPLFNKYELYIPNKELYSIFQNEIINRYANKEQISILSNLRKAFLDIKEVDIKKTLEQYFLSNLSYFEFNNEKSYQIVFGTIIAFLFEDATISFEANTGQGRSDIFIRTKKDNSLSIIIETKFLKGRRGRDRIDGSLEEGWNQINEMDYLEEANRIESKNILAYSVVFNNKKVYVSGKRIK